MSTATTVRFEVDQKTKVTERIREVILAEPDWGTIDDLYSRVASAGVMTEDVREAHFEAFTKQLIRRAVKSIKGDDGCPAFESIETVDDTGASVKQYKQVALFDEGDFYQAVQYHRQQSQAHLRRAAQLMAMFRERFGKQMDLPFASEDEA